MLGICGILMIANAATTATGQGSISAAQAASLAQDRFAGAILDVEHDDPEPHERAIEVFEVRLLTAGNAIIRVRIDANTGEFLEAAGDNLIPALKLPKR